MVTVSPSCFISYAAVARRPPGIRKYRNCVTVLVLSCVEGDSDLFLYRAPQPTQGYFSRTECATTIARRTHKKLGPIRQHNQPSLVAGEIVGLTIDARFGNVSP